MPRMSWACMYAAHELSMHVCVYVKHVCMYVCWACMYVCMLNYRPRGWVQFLTKNVQYLNDNSIFWDLWGGVLPDALTYIHTCSAYIHTYMHTYIDTYIHMYAAHELSMHVCMDVKHVCMYVKHVCMYVEHACMLSTYACMLSFSVCMHACMHVCMLSMYVCMLGMYVCLYVKLSSKGVGPIPYEKRSVFER